MTKKQIERHKDILKKTWGLKYFNKKSDYMNGHLVFLWGKEANEHYENWLYFQVKDVCYDIWLKT